ncbi:bifunctional diguanylate cyclase/phosphodiesterase [Halanaerobium salsuginis]|jgi:EAL domain-containing protein (putative c-di-GMP-specific phosphodiesterase class I)|uniref:EAL domain, c-di-GMP-specific phosphodiesterase class I (Or its enzymatically inactive variant) n=1 Tax=Halanaerobium salsuginis TaxID=29563 RepID=A0A1I4N2W8_9FIRM|nr:GGDEF domain-containing phosphodiesterase [Halanaerobium salsuginis]SFM09676.1 EAL domain, c-di-GMP-specific phosphodiesterase class I (or its enzymatically inactive variant) [Halanaerobium salsuginis]
MIKQISIYLKLKRLSENKFLSFLIILFLLSLISYLVYKTGGTQYSYIHLIYLPIIFTAYLYKIRGGLVSALLAGLLLGPLMPLNTAAMLSQQNSNWIFRTLFLILIGIFSGCLFSLIEQQLGLLNKLAYFNSEISLPTKIKFKQIVEERISGQKDFYLLILSINNFFDIYKLIGFMNSTKYISQFLQNVQKFIGHNSLIYYISEDKYGIVLPKNKYLNVKIFLNRLAKYLEKPIEFKGLSIFNDISFGLSSYPENSSIFAELIDQALVALKNANDLKKQYYFYKNSAIESKNNKIELLAAVKKSIDNNSFELYYQPKINLYTRKVETFEALIRWNHPEKGLISPAEFIPIVEQSSLIQPLTDWVLKTALADIAEFNQNFKFDFYNIAINISARNLQNPEFADSLISHLNSAKVAAKNLSLEITETDLMLEIESNIKKLKKLKENGIKIYLDDFGKGYSSLKYLKEIPIDYLKIDRYFILNIGKDKSVEEIISAIIKLAHSLNIEVVAEGVESEEQLLFLEKLACDYAQGFYFACPEKKEKVISWLQDHYKIESL